MPSSQLVLRDSPYHPSVMEKTLDMGAGWAMSMMRYYYWLVDIAPVLLRYQAKQQWRNAKREIGYLADDLMGKVDEWMA